MAFLPAHFSASKTLISIFLNQNQICVTLPSPGPSFLLLPHPPQTPAQCQLEWSKGSRCACCKSCPGSGAACSMATVQHNRHSVTMLPCQGWILWLKYISSHTKSYAVTYIHITLFSSVQSLSHVCLFVTPWTAARQVSLSTNNSQSLLKLMSIKSVTPSNHLILCRPLLLFSIIPSIRVFSSESVVPIRWPKYQSFSFSISPSNEYSGLIPFRMDWLDLLAVQGTLKSLLQHHSSKASILRHSAFFTVQLSHPYMTTGKIF